MKCCAAEERERVGEPEAQDLFTLSMCSLLFLPLSLSLFSLFPTHTHTHTHTHTYTHIFSFPSLSLSLSLSLSSLRAVSRSPLTVASLASAVLCARFLLLLSLSLSLSLSASTYLSGVGPHRGGRMQGCALLRQRSEPTSRHSAQRAQRRRHCPEHAAPATHDTHTTHTRHTHETHTTHTHTQAHTRQTKANEGQREVLPLGSAGNCDCLLVQKALYPHTTTCERENTLPSNLEKPNCPRLRRQETRNRAAEMVRPDATPQKA